MDLGMQGQVAFITGASKGIGRATARLLSEEGCRVVVTARGKALLEEVAEEISSATGNEVHPITGDMMVDEDVQRAVAETLDRYGRIDVLVPCAGAAPGGLAESLSDDDWFNALNLKFMGYVRACRHVLPHMKERGSGAVVMVVGNDGLQPPMWEVAPGACNAADLNFAACMADQYGRFGIRVNTVNPGPVNTDRWAWIEESLAESKGLDAQTTQKLVKASLPVGRIAEPEEIANVVAFLASPRASYVNKAHVPVDGGQRKALMDADWAALDA
jgi:NAD(P)-dependent dehydrogenase (short-subunit alcohol dehydrogenase family)